MIRLGLLAEGKIPPDKRVAFTPAQAADIMKEFPGVKVVCQRSAVRSYKDEEYAAQGIDVVSDVSNCDILMGIKEVPIAQLVTGKMYLFFSHTIKKQPHNKKLLQAVLQKKITLIDYEALKDKQGNRLVAFGYYAGIVGTYNGLWIYGKRYGLYNLRRAFECFDLEDLKSELKKIKLPPIKILLTGSGRVGKGSVKMLEETGIKRVSPEDFLSKRFEEPVYTQVASADYHLHKERRPFDRHEFHTMPERYKSDFLKYARVADMLIAGAYWDPRAPLLFTGDEMRSEDFNIRIIADITCDINGSIPCTKKSSTVVDPVYDYNPINETVVEPLSGEKNITIMAVDNLPCELPRSASQDFGRDLFDRVLPSLLSSDTEGIIERSIIAREGQLTKTFHYLQDYAS
jgi:saccharopine dehydrogenase (NAD+, L-lysine forming)